MDAGVGTSEIEHDHVFLGEGHERSERRAWAVIALCGATMVVEIVGGLLFGSIALVADGLHMSTHAGALLLAALAYSFARRHAHDTRFTFGTGKLGDLAGFTSAIVLALITLLIGYEAVGHLLHPVPIDVAEALPIAVLGLAVNVASVWLLGHGHDHDHGRHGHDEHGHDHAGHEHALEAGMVAQPEGGRAIGAERRRAASEEQGHGRRRAATHEDNNMRAAVLHVFADAAVSVLVIVGLVLARLFGWSWTDPLAGLIGAAVIAAWSWSLVRATGGILLDVNPDQALTRRIREAVEAEGDRVADLHLWRLGPGHLGAILAVRTAHPRDPAFYRAKLAGFHALSHITVEVGAA